MSCEQVTTGLKKINEFEINDENSLLEELLNHGHLLAMVACLYDPEVFLTDDECKEKYNMEVNVQKPELYMLARCQSSDNYYTQRSD